VVKMLKDSRQYDNTLITFASDSGTAEPAPLLSIKFSSSSASAMESILKELIIDCRIWHK